MLVVTNTIKIPLREIHFSFVKGSGKGGQKVNKSATRAVLVWNIEKNKSLPEGLKKQVCTKLEKRISRNGDIVIKSNRYRDRGRNVADCLEKLKDLLLKGAQRSRVRKKSSVPKSSKATRLENKRRRGQKKRLRQKVRPPAEEE